jgi:hypothetical protein
VNADALKSLADRAATVEGHGPQRLTEVHARIRTARRRRAAAFAGTLVLVVILGGVALTRSLMIEDAIGPSDRIPTPSTIDPAVPPGPRVGFIGLPPPGAIPSGPNSAELVLSYFGRDPGSGKGQLWVYDDGRLIVERDGDHPEGANASSTGFLEQRLTPDGIQTLRAYVLSNGEPPVDEPPFLGELRVRDGDRLIDLEPAIGFDAARLMNPAGWLPDSAWEYREPRGYVPSSFVACYGSMQPVARSRLLEPLPDPAADLLGDNSEQTSDEGTYCSVVTTEEARAIDGWLQGAGLQQGDSTYNLNYWFEAQATQDQPDPPEARIWFEPVLPDGQSTCSDCG